MPSDHSARRNTDFTQTTVLKLPKTASGDLVSRLAAQNQAAEPPKVDWDDPGSDSQLRLYREFIEGIYDAVLIVNLKGWVVDANSRASEFFLLSKRQFRGLRLTDLVCGTNDTLLNQLIEDLANGVRLILEASCLRRDRTVFPGEITVNVLHIAGVPHLCFLIRNISRRLEAESALRESEERFRDISESTSDWIWEIDLRGQYTYCTEKAEQILGYSVADLVGRSIFQHTSLEHRALGQRRLGELIDSKRSFRNFEIWLRRHDRQWRCISFSGGPVHDDDARLVGFRGIAADITEQKTRDAELEKHRHHLEELVLQRTAELRQANDLLTREVAERVKAETELHQAVAGLERSNAELQQFGYVVSHDLKEPLRMIASYCQLIERRTRGVLPQESREFIAYAVDGAERMQRMIDDLLAYTRLSTAERHADLCDLNQIAALCRRNLKFAIEDANATLEIGPLPTVRGDRTQLLLLIQNLVANALKFSRDGVPPRITIAALPPESGTLPESWPQTGQWTIRVTDNGIGIPADSLEDIFLIFHRLQATKDCQGTGIGLAICRKIVDNHGGTIRAESQEGAGTTFIFTLPGQANSV